MCSAFFDHLFTSSTDKLAEKKWEWVQQRTKKLRKTKWELLHKRIKNKKCRARLFIHPAVSVIWQAESSTRRRRRGRRRGWDVNWGEKKAPERLSLLVLAAVAPAAHGGCGAERPIHPAHQGRTRHRKTGRKRGYSSWTHCLSVWRPGLSNQTALWDRGRERKYAAVWEREREMCATSITTVRNIKRKTVFFRVCVQTLGCRVAATTSISVWNLSVSLLQKCDAARQNQARHHYGYLSRHIKVPTVRCIWK